jgi:hypothetical protein
MTRFAPSSLRGQLVLLILAALILAQGISLWLFFDERGMAVRAALGLEAAGRAANVARLIEEAPESLHASILRAADSPLVRFSLDPAPAVDHVNHADGGAVAARIRALLNEAAERAIRVEVHELEPAPPPGVPGMTMPGMTMPGMFRGMAERHHAMMGHRPTSVEMQLSIALRGGEWLNVATRFHRPPLQWAWASAVTFGLTASLIVAVIWFASGCGSRPSGTGRGCGGNRANRPGRTAPSDHRLQRHAGATDPDDRRAHPDACGPRP